MKKAAQVVKFLLFLAFGILLLFFAFRGNNPSHLLSSLKNIRYPWLFLVFVVSFLAHISRAIRWNMLIAPLGHTPRFTNTLASVLTGYLANLAIPRMGEVSRCATLARAENLPFEKLLGTVIAERIMDLVLLAVCIMIMAVFEFKLLSDFLWVRIFEPVWLKVILWGKNPLTWIIFIMLTIMLIILVRKKQKRTRSENKTSKLKTLVQGVLDGFQSFRLVKNKGLFIFHSFFIWTMYFLSSYLFFFVIPETSGLGLSAGLFTLVAGSLGMTAPVQGGIGVYHLLVSQGLTLFGLNIQNGLTYATISHSFQILLILFGGTISIIYFSVKQDKNDKGRDH